MDRDGALSFGTGKALRKVVNNIPTAFGLSPTR
jgi:hypothetical protein